MTQRELFCTTNWMFLEPFHAFEFTLRELGIARSVCSTCGLPFWTPRCPVCGKGE